MSRSHTKPAGPTITRGLARPNYLPLQPAIAGFIKTSLRQPRASLPSGKAVAQMADDMREAAYREGGLTREGLELLGYTRAQIDTLTPAARARANELSALTA
jgi:hypothetical protein